MTSTYWRIGVLAAIAGLTLSACGGGNASVTTGTSTSPGNPPTQTTPPGNHAPSISGTPSGSVTAGAPYNFSPTASDADGNTLTFTITNKPSWAVFDTATGTLSGTAQAGTYTNIVISVSDGTTSTALPSFAIAVNAATPAGTATLSWTAPTQNTDGSALTDLAGYRVYHGTDPNALNDIIQLASAGTTTYTFSQLASGTHYFAVSAYTSSGVESALSGTGSKTIP